MNKRVAKTKTIETAWRLIDRIKPLCPFNDFAVVLLSPTAQPEVVPLRAFHPKSRIEVAEEIKKFSAEMQVTASR